MTRLPISGTIIKIDPGMASEVFSRVEKLKGLALEEKKVVEGALGKQEYSLFTTVDDMSKDELGYVLRISVDDIFPSYFRSGIDWARTTRKYRVRVYNEGFVMVDCSRRDLTQFIYPFEEKIMGLKDAFRMCAVNSDEIDKLINDPKMLEIRASLFTDFKLSSVSTGSLYGLKLETTKEFTDFKKRARLRTLMVRMSTPHGLMTMLITQDCGFVLYSKVPPDREAEIFESLVKAIALPMVE